MRAVCIALLIMSGVPACEQQASESVSNSSSQQRSATERAIVDYQTARAVLWNSLYADGGQTLYCGQVFAAGYRKGINIEHVFPMSWVTKSLHCGTRTQCREQSAMFNLIEADLHNLYPARSVVNEDRSSFPFGEVPGEVRRYGPDCDFEVNQRTRTAEPAPAIRGEVARAMFYMAHKYHKQELTIFARQGRMLHAWHLADPPGVEERNRNRLIEKLQGNRNPFIDDPDQLSKLVAEGFFY